ncbi:MAG: hypothetical protein QM752_05885 [Gammaproteobacteria bacterium]
MSTQLRERKKVQVEQSSKESTFQEALACIQKAQIQKAITLLKTVASRGYPPAYLYLHKIFRDNRPSHPKQDPAITIPSDKDDELLYYNKKILESSVWFLTQDGGLTKISKLLSNLSAMLQNKMMQEGRKI